ncbi:hypothetical protein TanjilG_30267 [Lupinus angustifolius]|uniref:Uncharacterized protein n=1 Tax=Lupinus angustifolius TaxID=3871 RepID=A0A4P1R793_LUPAN|nr:hypothetical protein TanjilG_30267 [Lupinus angustifolius]
MNHYYSYSLRRATVGVMTRRYSSVTGKKSKATRRPKEIPFQPRVSNSVNLIGEVIIPVQFQTGSDGTAWASTVISREHSPHYVWIPLIFEGHLAHTAISHLKPHDFIHIAGQLTTDPPHFPIHRENTHTNVQVMVKSLNFVQGYPLQNNDASPTSSESEKHEINQSAEDFNSKQIEENNIDEPWKDLLLNPGEWWDVRLTKKKSKGAAFERKKDGELLFIDSSTPKWLEEKLELLTFDLKPVLEYSASGAKKNPAPNFVAWRDLLQDSKQWFDFRDSKHNGLVSPNFPDFKRKDDSLSIWLNGSPKWVLPKLEALEIDVPVVKPKQANAGDESWNDLLNNPIKWWDNRSNKKNEKGPDFKNKETGEALWLNGAAKWVLSKLEGTEIDVPVVESKQATTAKGDESWNDLLNNPDKWWDNRSNKKNEKGPDFKNKETGEALWLNGAPKWVLSKLEGTEIDVPVVESKQATTGKGDESWNDLLNNPDKWWDKRSNKKNEKCPDFEHKVTVEALWLNGAPKWVLSKLERTEIDVPIVESKQASTGKGNESWNDLLNNPDKWWDNRSNNKNEKCPDFKHKETGETLWLNVAPKWILSKLERAEIDVPIVESKQATTGKGLYK